MPLTLYVDGPAWRDHLRATADERPGIVPVAKGNGYGFGIGRLARRCQWLGVSTMAVGTYSELAAALSRFDRDVLVLEPYRPLVATNLPRGSDRRVVHTVGRRSDLVDLVDRSTRRPRVAAEALTSMTRHGFEVDDLRAVSADHAGAALEGVTLHLPLGDGHVAEVEQWISALSTDGKGPLLRRWYLSHVDPVELAALRGRHPDLEFLPRIGTELWLGRLDALSVRASVIDRHLVRRGDRVGYRQRPIRTDGWLLVVSGGTSHGIGLESPSPATSSRQRLVALARGGLESTGRVRSPFVVAGVRRWFVEPPHMQVSMVFVPESVDCPAIGDEVVARVRFTTTTVDRVVVR